MRGQIVDSFAQQGNLYFGRARVFGMLAILLDHFQLGLAQRIPPSVTRTLSLLFGLFVYRNDCSTHKISWQRKKFPGQTERDFSTKRPRHARERAQDAR